MGTVHLAWSCGKSTSDLELVCGSIISIVCVGGVSDLKLVCGDSTSDLELV